MRFVEFSPRQKQVLAWWTAASPHRELDAVICDGAVRSGKTLALGISFVLWAMHTFDGMAFAICGRSVRSCERNVVEPLLPVLRENMCLDVRHHRAGGYVQVSGDGRSNRFYLFGGRDESSYASIQGLTLAGVLLDEVVLMPRSFVEHALARCSVTGSRFWFSCNPQGPGHWFYREWIEKAGEKRALYLRFTMRDNPSLDAAVRGRYERMFAGVFHERYVLGRWVQADGLVYPMFSGERHVFDGQETGPGGRYFISVDYGTRNPFAAGLWLLRGGEARMLAEYYHDARETGRQLDDEQYHGALLRLWGDRPVERVVVDPSAASFIACIHRHGVMRVSGADNHVLDGIRNTATALENGWVRFHRSCANTIREFGEYVWDERAGGDAPKKEHDHAMDQVRYFVQSVLVYERKWR